MSSKLPYDQDNRTNSYKSNPLLADLLIELKKLLEPVQKVKQEEFDAPKWPVGLIVGVPRTGSTLLMQWIASLKVFSYPSNLLTRFAYAPYIGALIQKMLFDPEYDYSGDFYDIKSCVNYESDLGKSKGALAVNVFAHYLRNYLPNFEPEHLDENTLKTIDISAIRKGYASIEFVFNKPFFTKGSMLQFNLDFFYEKMPELFIIMINREPILSMQSLIYSREKYYGTRDKWWSVKPDEYNYLKDMDVYHQVAGQVYYTEQAILKGLSNIPKERKILVNYEEFCNDPKKLFEEIKYKYNALGYEIKVSYDGPGSFTFRNELTLPSKELDKLTLAYKKVMALNY